MSILTTCDQTNFDVWIFLECFLFGVWTRITACRVAFKAHVLKFAQRTVCSGAGVKLPGSDNDQVSLVFTSRFSSITFNFQYFQMEDEFFESFLVLLFLILAITISSFIHIHHSCDKLSICFYVICSPRF